MQRLLIIYFCSLSLFLCAQVNSNATLVTACAPHNLSFVAPTGATNISWTFGPFPGSTSAYNAFSINSPVTFTATFSGTVGGTPTTFSTVVVINPKPVANFSIQQPFSNCALKTVTLVNASTGSSPLQSWQWIYGDGAFNTFTSGATHTHGYNYGGNYSVTLIVVDANGCDDQVTVGTVSVVNSPTAVISSNPPTLVTCQGPFNVSFSATNSIGNNNASYSWNFGNGQTSILPTVANVSYSQQASPYVVFLTVSSGGCSGATSSVVVVNPATLSVTVPNTVCASAPFIATVQTNQPYSIWDLVGFNTVYVGTPLPPANTVQVTGFPTAGIHTIQVNAGTPQCPAPVITRTIAVEQVTASFSNSNPTVSCSSPFIISYTSTSSSNAIQLQWLATFPPGTITSSATGTSAQFTIANGSLNQYSIYERPITPTISLIATSASGCSAVLTKTVHSLERPAAWFNVDKRQGCVPLTVSFRDSSIVYPSCPITSYTWNNGASPATIITGTCALPPATNSRIPWQSFTYTAAGTYSPYLMITTASNYVNTLTPCSDNSFTDVIVAANPPTVSFNVLPGPYCPYQPVQIVNTTPNLNTIQHWHVDSDNGFFSGCMSDPNPSWKFTHVGVHTFTLTGYQNECSGTATGGSVTIQGPIAEARYETNCNVNRSSVSFSVELQEVQQAVLFFGDGATATLTGISSPGGTTVLTTSHVYTATGNYTAVVSASNALTGCLPSTYTMLVTVRNVQANIVQTATACSGTSYSLNASTSIDVQTGCSRGYLWYIDDLPPLESSNPVMTTTLFANGQHTVVLFVKDVNGCTDTETLSVRVSSVDVSISVASPFICGPSSVVQFTGNALQIPDPIIASKWVWGNPNASFTLNAAPGVVTNTYINTNPPSPTDRFLAWLTATNALGCVGGDTILLVMIEPVVSFVPSNTVFCFSSIAPTTVSFVPTIPYPSYTINYGVPGATFTSSGTTAYSYSIAGLHSVNITVENEVGCKSSAIYTVNAIQTPTADFIFSNGTSSVSNQICSGQVLTFTNVSIPQTYTPSWNIVPGNSNTIATFFSSPVTTVVPVSMSVTTGSPAFCTASTSKNFTIYSFDADIVLSNSVVCLGEALTFSIAPGSYGLGAWIWSYGDASSSPTIMANTNPLPLPYITHTYSTFNTSAAGIASVSLIFWSQDMACRDAVEKEIKVIKVEVGFLRNSELLQTDSIHCINIPDKFTSTSTVNSSTLNHSWSFGDAAVSNSRDPVYIYPLAGNYTVSLTVENENGCKRTANKSMTIHPLPTATIFPDQVLYCPNTTFSLGMMGSPGVNSGTWSPAANIVGSPVFTTAAASYSQPATASSNINYSLTVTNTNNCVSEPVDTTILVIQPPVPTNWDTTVVIGQPAPIHVILPPDITYTWSPIIEQLSCTLCLDPVSTSTNNIVYTLLLEDKLHCSQVSSSYSVNILPETTLDVPTAFTPNGDNINDIIYADGWGIKDFHFFRIYNRWGQLLFETNDLKKGWDGKYQGIPQNMDTYVYQAEAGTYLESQPVIFKSGSFKLIR